MKKMIKQEVENYIEDLFTAVHEQANTTSGDITPEQVFRLEKIQKELENLIYEQVKQNF